MVMAKTPSLNATSRMVSWDTEGGSAPVLPPGARAVASQCPQRITEERGGRSQIEHYVVAWLGAADECASFGGRFDRVGAVVEIAGDEGGLAVVAHAGAA